MTRKLIFFQCSYQGEPVFEAAQGLNMNPIGISSVLEMWLMHMVKGAEEKTVKAGERDAVSV